MSGSPGYFHLNLDNVWPSLVLKDALEIGESGELTLARLPALVGMPAPVQSSLPAVGLDGPAGIAIDRDGSTYLADPGHNAVLRVDPCDGSLSRLGCLSGPGSQPEELTGPRGLLIGPRGFLYIADSGNHRVQVVDPASGQVVAIWGPTDPWVAPEAPDFRSAFQQPWDLAADVSGNVYLADPGLRQADGSWSGGQVLKFDADGRSDAAFLTTISAQSPSPVTPVALTVGRLQPDDPSSVRLFVLDNQPVRLLVYSLDGLVDEAACERFETVGPQLEALGPSPRPIAVRVVGDAIYVADAASGQLLVFGADGRFIGRAAGVTGPLTGLAVDHEGRLLLYAGDGSAPRRVQPGLGFVESGAFLAGPFQTPAAEARWFRLVLDADVPADTHLRLSVHIGSEATRPETPWAGSAAAWVTAPADALELLIPDTPGGALWIACRLTGEGVRSPTIRQARVEYGHEGWLRSLPAIYQRADDGSHFLARALALFESALETESRLVDALPALFDPAAAPDAGAPGGWLDWLAGWLDVELDERWSGETRRHAIAEAFALHGQRGTLAGLRRTVELYAGVRALIHEPANDALLWSLGERSVLDFTTQLAPEEPRGTVVGTSAVLDESHLIRDEDFGAPLVEDLAHRFCVQLYRSDVRDGDTLANVRRVLDRDKPAHTTYHLCTIEPRSLLGFQARLGIDAIVGGPAPDLVLDSPRELDRDAVLPDAPPGPPAPRRLGDDVRLGWRSTLV